MEKESMFQPVIEIKNILSKKDFILGIFLSRSTIDNEDNIDLFILIENDQYIEETINLITTVKSNHPIHPDIWSLEAFQKSDQATVHQIFKDGKLIYWNAMVDVLASQVLKVKAYTIFTFAFKNFTQKDKVRFNYQLYGKKDNGLLNQWQGERLAKSCFYVPYISKYKVTRYLNNIDVEYTQKDTYF